MDRLVIPIVLAAVCAVAPATAEDFTTLDLAVSGRIVASPCRFASTSTSNVDFGRVMLADFREGETVGTPQAVTLRFEGCRLSPADSTGTGIIDDSIDFGTVRVSLHDVGGYGDAASEGLVSSRGAVVRLTTRTGRTLVWENGSTEIEEQDVDFGADYTSPQTIDLKAELYTAIGRHVTAGELNARMEVRFEYL